MMSQRVQKEKKGRTYFAYERQSQDLKWKCARCGRKEAAYHDKGKPWLEWVSFASRAKLVDHYRANHVGKEPG